MTTHSNERLFQRYPMFLDENNNIKVDLYQNFVSTLSAMVMSHATHTKIRRGRRLFAVKVKLERGYKKVYAMVNYTGTHVITILTRDMYTSLLPEGIKVH